MVEVAEKLKHTVVERGCILLGFWLPGEIWVISPTRVVSVAIWCIS